MDLDTYMPPIAVASFVFGVWLYVVLFFHDTENRGRESFLYILLFTSFPLTIVAFLISKGRNGHVETYFDQFMGALIPIAAGGGVFFYFKMLVLDRPLAIIPALVGVAGLALFFGTIFFL